jgi:hypothetical protein
MRSFALAALALTSSCATSGTLAGGPTIDGAGHVGIDVDGTEGGITNGNLSPELASLWIVGVEATLGGTTARPYGSASLAPYVEYVRLGSLRAPWGVHARLALGGVMLPGPATFVKLNVGPERMESQTMTQTNDGPATTSRLSGVDVSLRVRVRTLGPWERPRFTLGLPSSWQVGLLYVRRETVLY